MSVFTQKAPGIIHDLMDDFSLSDFQAAAIVGNLGHESGGLTKFQEQRPTVRGSRGGYGWAQWTGPRRRKYEQWCAKRKLSPKSDEANYGFLCVELKGPYASSIRALKRTETLREAVTIFERMYEAAGIPGISSRVKWAKRALDAYNAASPQGLVGDGKVDDKADDDKTNDKDPATKDDDADKGVPGKSGISEGAQVAGGLGGAGLMSQVWEGFKDAPEDIRGVVVHAFQKPTSWMFLSVLVVGVFIWWRRRKMKQRNA